MSKLDDIKSSESKSFKKLNPHIFGGGPLLDEKHPYGHVNLMNHGGEDDAEHDHIAALAAKRTVRKRIRQSDKLMNGLEAEFFERIRYEYPNYPRPKPQAVKLKISNGAFFKPDFFVTAWPHAGGHAMATAWEVKGLKGKNIDRGKLALKCAASAWPEIKFILVWKDEQGNWQEQLVLP